MWMEEPSAQRPGIHRTQELLATEAQTVTVGCPFCKVMIGDCVAQIGGEGAPSVKDVAEVMVEAMQEDS
jgi:Fe-S oxidoreductase